MGHTTLSSYYDPQISYNHKCLENMSVENVKPQTHNAFEIIYVKKGSLTYIIDEKTFKVEDDSLILTRPGKMHMINFDSLRLYDRYDIIFDENIVFNEVYEKLFRSGDVISCKGFPEISALFEKADFYCAHFFGDALKNVLSHLIDEIAYNIVVAQGTSFKKTDYSTNPLFAKVIEYIDNNITRDFTLDTMCTSLYISKSHLHNIFRAHLNITPKKYIASKRLIFAQKMLQDGYAATKVFEKCAFSDYSAFYRSYKNHFGYPPSNEKNMNSIRKIMY